MKRKEFLAMCAPDCWHIRETGAMDFIRIWCTGLHCDIYDGDCDLCNEMWLESEYPENFQE